MVKGKEIPYLEGVIKHPAQKEIHFGRWRYYVAMWGRRTGKTIAAAALVTAYLMVPNMRVWIVAPNYELTDRTFEYVYNWVVIQKVLGANAVKKASHTDQLRLIQMKNGSFVKGKSTSPTAVDSLIGDQLDLLVLDEAARIPKKVWEEALEPTTLDRKGRVLFISTPRGRNWFYDLFLRKDVVETFNKGWRGSNFRSADNPFLDREWLESKRAQTETAIYNQEYEASPDFFSGLYFPQFRDRLIKHGGHVFDPRETELPEGTDYLGGDIGWKHPTAWLWGRADKENNIWIHQEYVQAGSDHESHAKEVAARCQGLKIYDGWIDPSASRKNPLRPGDDLCVQDIYRENGIYCRKANNDVMFGIGRITSYLNASLQAGSLQPGVYISVDCPNLRAGLGRYERAEVKGRQDTDQPDQPKKYRDDEVDAMRYLLAAEPSYVPRWAREEYQEPRPRRVVKTKPGLPQVAGGLYG